MDVVYAVDAVILTDNGIPLVKRKYEPFKNSWAIPGGHLDREDYLVAHEDLEKALQIAAVREAKEEAVDGDVELIRKIGVYDRPGRDPRGNYVSHAYLARLVNGQIRAASDAKEIYIFKEMPCPMAFDHEEILRDSKVFEKFKKRRMV
jgi:8-oxo-dGTP diphosphatase